MNVLRRHKRLSSWFLTIRGVFFYFLLHLRKLTFSRSSMHLLIRSVAIVRCDHLLQLSLGVWGLAMQPYGAKRAMF